MGIITGDLDTLFDETFGAQRLTFGTATCWGYLDQEENLQADASGDHLLVKRTVMRIKTPKADSAMDSIAADSSVTVYDPETNVNESYVVSDREQAGDGRETRLILRPA